MSGRETIDLSPVGKEILEHRAARRNKLRYEYLKQTQNPYRHGLGIGGCVVSVYFIPKYLFIKKTISTNFITTIFI